MYPHILSEQFLPLIVLRFFIYAEGRTLLYERIGLIRA
jgi:hypothetical protein